MQVELCQKNLDAFYSLWTDPPEILRDVYERKAGDQIVLVFTSKAILLKANANDTLSVHSRSAGTFHANGAFIRTRSMVWSQFIGKPFGWGWVNVNQQGYCDGALLSFDGITPNISLVVAASAIETHRIVPREESPILGIEIIENGEFSVRHFSVFSAKSSYGQPLDHSYRLPNYPLLPAPGTA